LREAARRAERELERLTRERETLEASLADPATYERGADVAAIRRRLDELARLAATAEAHWLEAEEQIERVEAA
jgi:ATP-binding cassette subfamily F protein 3